MDNVEYGIQETEAKKGKNPARVSALAGFFFFYFEVYDNKIGWFTMTSCRYSYVADKRNHT